MEKGCIFTSAGLVFSQELDKNVVGVDRHQEDIGLGSWKKAAKGKPSMNALQGSVINGQIVLDEAAELPEGSRVEVFPVPGARLMLGMREEEWPTTPEGIAALLTRMDQVEPGWLSPEDDAAWRAALRAQKDREKDRFLEDAEALGRMWQ